jgi:hypothetical protein
MGKKILKIQLQNQGCLAPLLYYSKRRDAKQMLYLLPITFSIVINDTIA